MLNDFGWCSLMFVDFDLLEFVFTSCFSIQNQLLSGICQPDSPLPAGRLCPACHKARDPGVASTAHGDYNKKGQRRATMSPLGFVWLHRIWLYTNLFIHFLDPHCNGSKEIKIISTWGYLILEDHESCYLANNSERSTVPLCHGGRSPKRLRTKWQRSERC